ncbi:uncharacterized protein GGS22DRAFT_52983 [Annulohypoxylon maeteangense]|uniref:uncharacterized protein n=1 Tax=Annulohypoxylon maeteangense TaxID=1927788 RepID=UPI0020072E46|nr:uncharacterized protein GGS22DRAFT_52983 [Annulohypoxylon maeteangense]KAI0881962.1 hypothetical protein GGS22DRAFT_52983 [Annulohypoxylon maeteangense]
MPTARLTFLYPHLFRTARFGESSAQRVKIRCRKSPNNYKPRMAAFSSTTPSRQAVFERHGKAVEPFPVTPDVVNLPPPSTDPSKLPSFEPATKESANKEKEKETAQGPQEEEDVVTKELEKSEAILQAAPTASNSPPSSPQQAATEAKMQESGPMEAVLHMPPPEDTHHPHISTPPYVHHFDSYTLVKELEAGGYSKDQAITVMKAIRGLLAENLDVAQEGLISKSDVENETYLFRAACSELSAEVQNNRKGADETTRQQRTQLQHEVDIVNQRMSQDLMTLKDDVKGMFNDRRMNVREEQRTMESAIQQLNLKISVDLNSDSRSDIEGLRWVLIRRSVLGILFMAVCTLGTLRYATYLKHERQREVEEKALKAEKLRNNHGREDHAPPVDAAEILAAN